MFKLLLNNLGVAQAELANIGRWLANKGWSPATSSNYSIRISDEDIAITRSGVDKSTMTEDDVILVDRKGVERNPEKGKSSAETLIHTTLYDLKPKARCVLHTHSVFGTRLSMRYAVEGQIRFSGYEVLKGLESHSTHETEEILPILPNAQDMVAFSSDLKSLFEKHPQAHGFLIEGHGLYTWADTSFNCKRQVETFEFLLECKAYELLGV